MPFVGNVSIYALTQLLPWVRRAGSDRLVRFRDVLTTDGSDTVLLQNDGNVIITSITLGGTLLTPSQYTQDVNVITFNSTPPTQTSVVAVYQRSNYTDVDTLAFIVDGVKNVISDVGLHFWQFDESDPTNPQVAFPAAPIFVPSSSGLSVGVLPYEKDWMDEQIERLVAIKSSILVRRDLNNQNADAAIMIKDGDTTIDTSRTAGATYRVIVDMETEYERLKRQVIANRATGLAIQNNWVPLPYPWSTPNMMPGEVNGPTY